MSTQAIELDNNSSPSTEVSSPGVEECSSSENSVTITQDSDFISGDIQNVDLCEPSTPSNTTSDAESEETCGSNSQPSQNIPSSDTEGSSISGETDSGSTTGQQGESEFVPDSGTIQVAPAGQTDASTRTQIQQQTNARGANVLSRAPSSVERNINNLSSAGLSDADLAAIYNNDQDWQRLRVLDEFARNYSHTYDQQWKSPGRCNALSNGVQDRFKSNIDCSDVTNTLGYQQGLLKLLESNSAYDFPGAGDLRFRIRQNIEAVESSREYREFNSWGLVNISDRRPVNLYWRVDR